MTEHRSVNSLVAGILGVADPKGMDIVGRGRCAELLALSDVRVLKLYEPRFDSHRVGQFVRRGQQVHAAGVRTPEIHQMTSTGDQHGIIMDRIYGTTLWEAIRSNPESAEQFGNDLAELHCSIHERSVAGLDSKLDEVGGRVAEREGKDEAVRQALALIEEGSADPQVLLHGDLHPANVMVDESGALISIDWDGAMYGPAAYDVARGFYLIAHWALAPGTDPLPAEIRLQVAQSYVAQYCSLAAIDPASLKRWFLPALLARYSENVPEEIPFLDEQVKKFTR